MTILSTYFCPAIARPDWIQFEEDLESFLASDSRRGGCGRAVKVGSSNIIICLFNFIIML